jgi:hypothetical protein
MHALVDEHEPRVGGIFEEVWGTRIEDVDLGVEAC